jgi:hypothetical protein
MIRKLLCILGWHTWTYSLTETIEEFGYLPLDNRVPSTAKCKHCGVRYE